MISVAAIQLASGPNIEANLLQVEALLLKAAENGSNLIVLPENFAFMGNTEREKVKQSERQGDGRIQQFLSAHASQLGVWIIGEQPFAEVVATVRNLPFNGATAMQVSQANFPPAFSITSV